MIRSTRDATQPRFDLQRAQARLAEAIRRCRAIGYTTARTTPTTALMVQAKRFSTSAYLVFGGAYATAHAIARDRRVYLSIDPTGVLCIRKA